MTTWHRTTRADWYATGIDSHDEADCPDPTTCAGEVIPLGHNRHGLRDSWMRGEAERRGWTVDDRTKRLSDLRADLARIEHDIESAVTDDRLAGVPWSAIGGALGMTRQAAQQRYGRYA